MTRFALIDLSNLYHRARYGSMVPSEMRVGMALLILFRSLRKLHRELQVDHMVFAADRGQSWRATLYPGYKARRRLERLSASPQVQEEQAAFFTAFDQLVDYLATATRCTVMAAPRMEGDDFIARWITRFPQDDHIIVSSDSDFVQLLAPQVRLFDPITQRTLSNTGILNEHGETLQFSVSPKNGKIKVGVIDPGFVAEPEWWRKALFIKLIRGDASDSVFAAFPGVRFEGRKCSIRAAWDDRGEQGYDWNNLMCQTWDKLLETGVHSVRVIDEYRRNELLIDLTKQPTDVMRTLDTVIDTSITRPLVKQVGIHFLRFCHAQDVPALIKEAADHVMYLNAPYPAAK